jgi:integrase/recombinase XerD
VVDDTGYLAREIGNLRFEDVYMTNVDVLNHYDGGEGQDNGPMGSHPQLDQRPNAVFIDTKNNRQGNKRKRPTVIPLGDELRRVLIDWLLIRPGNGSP